MPQFDDRRGVNAATGKEVAPAERGGASVKGQALPDHAQIYPLVGQEPALSELHPRNFHAGDFAGLQLLLDGVVKLQGRGIEAVDEGKPVIENLVLFCLEIEDSHSQESGRDYGDLAIGSSTSKRSGGGAPRYIVTPHCGKKRLQGDGVKQEYCGR